MRTNYVMIDFESVQPGSLELLYHDHFRVLVFLGVNQTKVPVDLATALQSMGGNAEYVRIAGSGKNALDFHIAFHIGQLSERDPKAFFHIISKDKGFDPLIAYLKGRGILAARSNSIDSIALVKAANAKTPEERAHLFMAKLDQPKVTKPRKIRTLSSTIGAFFQKQLGEEEIAAIVGVLAQEGFIIVEDGKVSYASAA
jgi:hypothetical protein